MVAGECVAAAAGGGAANNALAVKTCARKYDIPALGVATLSQRRHINGVSDRLASLWLWRTSAAGETAAGSMWRRFSWRNGSFKLMTFAIGVNKWRSK